MKFIETPLKGATLIEIEKLSDHRGFFARSWCMKEFSKVGLAPQMAQANVSYNHRKGTLRGMHYQVAPHEEAKLVRCTRGSIYDVIVDLRPDSNTRGEWVGVELSESNLRGLYIADGFAHGFQTLENDTEVLYQMFDWFQPELARGIRHDDPELQIVWPLEVSVISEKDRNYPDYRP